MSIINYQDYKCFTTVSIASGQTESSVAELLGTRCIAIITPSALTGTAFTLKASYDGNTYSDVYNAEGTQLSVLCSASRWIAIVPADLAGVAFLKLVSNASEGADTDIKIITRPLS